MAEKVYTVSEALKILRNSLRRCGLEQVYITVSSHNLTSEERGFLVKNLLAGGYGEKVTEAGEVFKYFQQSGLYSWVTVAQGNDRINLFYDLQ